MAKNYNGFGEDGERNALDLRLLGDGLHSQRALVLSRRHLTKWGGWFGALRASPK